MSYTLRVNNKIVNDVLINGQQAIKIVDTNQTLWEAKEDLTAIDYLKFRNTDSDSQTWSMNLSSANSKGVMEYAITTESKGRFVKYTSNSTLTIPGGSTLYLRGDGFTKLSSSSTTTSPFTTSNDASFVVSGNLNTLLQYNNIPTIPYAGWTFAYLFYDKSFLFDNIILPFSYIYLHGYEYMFCNCPNLKTPPELPATIVELYGYKNMFTYCTSLETAPELPATEIGIASYQYMFAGCISLKKAPSSLPATDLTTSSYEQMFSNCTSMTTAPVISDKTSTAEKCYYQMFYNCSKLKVRNSAASGATLFFTCPSSLASNQVTDMFTYTGGSFTGTPSSNGKYYYY